MMSENIARNMQSSQGTINYPTQLHLVGHFCKNFIIMHGTMNINFLDPLIGLERYLSLVECLTVYLKQPHQVQSSLQTAVKCCLPFDRNAWLTNQIQAQPIDCYVAPWCRHPRHITGSSVVQTDACLVSRLDTKVPKQLLTSSRPTSLVSFNIMRQDIT